MRHLLILVKSIFSCLPIRAQCKVASFFQYRPLRKYPKTFIHGSVHVLGSSHIRVGQNSVLSQGCWLNVNHRESKDLAIVIGDHCFIGRRNFFSSGRLIKIGSYVLTANDCQFLGSSHITDNPMVPCISTGTSCTDIIEIGHNTFMGAGARILGSVKIGHGCVIGAGSLVTKDVPPFSQAFGMPATVRQRYSFIRQTWIEAEAFTAEDEGATPTPDEYLATLRLSMPPSMPYIAAGSDMGNL